MEHILPRKQNVPFHALPSANHPSVQPLLHNSWAKRSNSIYWKYKVSELGTAFKIILCTCIFYVMNQILSLSSACLLLISIQHITHFKHCLKLLWEYVWKEKWSVLPSLCYYEQWWISEWLHAALFCSCRNC